MPSLNPELNVVYKPADSVFGLRLLPLPRALYTDARRLDYGSLARACVDGNFEGNPFFSAERPPRQFIHNGSIHTYYDSLLRVARVLSRTS